MFAALSLSKVTCKHLLLLVGFDTLTYRKHYDRSPRLVGHQESFIGTVVGEVNELYPPTPASTVACVNANIDSCLLRLELNYMLLLLYLKVLIWLCGMSP